MLKALNMSTWRLTYLSGTPCLCLGYASIVCELQRILVVQSLIFVMHWNERGPRIYAADEQGVQMVGLRPGQGWGILVFTGAPLTKIREPANLREADCPMRAVSIRASPVWSGATNLCRMYLTKSGPSGGI